MQRSQGEQGGRDPVARGREIRPDDVPRLLAPEAPVALSSASIT